MRMRRPRSQRAVSRPFPECERYVNAAASQVSPGGGGLPSLAHHGTPAGLRPAHGRGARGPVDPALVHRRARPAQVLRHLARPSWRAPSTRACASTARPSTASAACRRATCSPGPTRTPSSCSRGPTPTAPRPACSATSTNLDGTPVRGRPPPGAAPQPRPGPRAGLHVLRRPRDGVLLLRRRRPVARRRSRSTRRRTSTSPPPTSPATCASARSTRSRRWASRSSTASTRTPRASTRSTCATPTPSPMADNVMTFRLVVREIALERGVHATFMPKPLAGVQGSGMHTHFSLFEGDTNAFHDPGDEYGLSKVGRGFIAGLLPTPARSPPSPTSGELLQAARRRLRGAGLRLVGPQQPLGARQRAADQGGQGRRRPASSTGRPTRPATRTSPSRWCWPPA